MEENNTTTVNWEMIKTTLIIGLVIGIILLLITQCHRDEVKANLAPDNAYKYDTEVVYKDKYKKLSDSIKGLVPIKPITLIQWKTPGIEYLPGEVIRDTIRIPNPSDTLYKNNPRLISMGLIQDTLSFTLYNKDNQLFTETYPIYLGSYGYLWEDNQLNMYDIKGKEETKTKPKNSFAWNNLFFNAGYSVYAKAPTTGLEYNITYGRLKLDLNSEVLIIEQPKLNLNAKIGYRLLK